MKSRTIARPIPLVLMLLLLCAGWQLELKAEEQSPQPYQWEQIGKIAETSIAEQGLAGLSLSVVYTDQPIFAKGFGYADIETQTPVRADSLFHTASISKLFVATSIMQLADRGLIDLDAPAANYLPGFPFSSDPGTPISIRMMLSHSAGIPDVEDYEWDTPAYSSQDARRYVRSLQGMELISTPGEEFNYSNIAFDTLGQVIAEVSGLSFEEYVQTRILSPLQMDSSSFLYANFKGPRLTAPHIRNEENGQLQKHPVYPYNRIHAPSSTLASNARDMGRWMLANLQRGELKGNRILPAATYRQMWQPETVINGENWVGLSWFHTSYKNEDLFYHSGGDTGYSAVCILVPDKQLGVTVMTNTDQAKVVSIALKIIELY